MQWQIPLYLLPATSLLISFVNKLALTQLLFEHFLFPYCSRSGLQSFSSFLLSQNLSVMQQPDMAPFFWLFALFVLINLQSAGWHV